eukprot:gene4056-8064_t
MNNRQRLNELIAQRDALELEAKVISDELLLPGPNGEPPAGRSGPVVDNEGFPRADIDIYRVMSNRQRLAVINTDHKSIMKLIESSLACVFNEGPVNHSISSKNAPRLTGQETPLKVAMGVIDQVSEGSPAAEAGLRNGDLVVSFGDISGSSENALGLIPDVVSTHINLPLPLVIERDGNVISTVITPKAWGGRGLLGLHLSQIR